jgi:cytochrome c oxidase subunit 2
MRVVPLALAALTVVTAIGFSGCSSGGEARPTTGKGIYDAYCATCHGVGGQGGVGPALAGVVVEKFPNIDDQFAVVRDGRGAMPAWGGDLSPKEIRKVVVYERTELGR